MRKFVPGLHPNTFSYVVERNTGNIRHTACGKVLLRNDKSVNFDGTISPYQCLWCDENVNGDEAFIGKSHTSEELNDLFNAALELLLLDE